MNSIDFGGRRSEVKAMIAIIYKCGMRGDATLCVVIFLVQFWRQTAMNHCYIKVVLIGCITCKNNLYWMIIFIISNINLT